MGHPEACDWRHQAGRVGNAGADHDDQIGSSGVDPPGADPVIDSVMRLALLLVCLGVSTLGCGSDDTKTQGPLVATADSESPSSGITIPESSSGAEASTTVIADPAPATAATSAIEDGIPLVQFDGEQSDTPAPYFGSQNLAGGAAAPVANFTPSSADQDFCSAVSVINSRPQPRDEFVEVVVADQYLAAIERYVPIDLRDEFDVVLEFTRSVVEAGSFDEELSSDGAISAAVGTINQFVDKRCLGLS